MKAMGDAALAGCRELAEITLVMPNRHHLLVDLTPFGRGEGWGGMPDVNGKGKFWVVFMWDVDRKPSRSEAASI